METVRFAIVGMGNQGSLYANILTGNPHPGRPPIPRPGYAVLTAVCDSSDKVFAQAAQLGVQGFTDWKQMLSSGCCDAIILTVPHFLHHEIGIYAMAHNVHVLCEKPAGVRASDVQEMLRVQKETSAAVGMVFQHRINPVFRSLKTIVESGTLGALRRSNWIVNHYWRPDNYYASGSWRGTWKGEGGGLLVNQLPHYLDLWLYLCGMPQQVYAMTRMGAYRAIEVDNDVTVLAGYANGGTGVFVACTHDPLGTDRLELDFEKGKIVVENSSHAVVYRFAESDLQWNQTLSFREMQQLQQTPEEHHMTEVLDSDLSFGVPYAELIENFAAHILFGTPLIATGLDGLKEVELANAIYLSGWTGETVSLPCDTHRFNTILQTYMGGNYHENQ